MYGMRFNTRVWNGIIYSNACEANDQNGVNIQCELDPENAQLSGEPCECIRR